jgi:hypothetical protein
MTIITIKRHRQPYTSETWEIHSAEPMDPTGLTGYMRSRADDGWLEVKGRILNSTTTSRLFSATSSRTTEEQPLHDYMPAKYLVDGASFVTIAG